LVCEMNENEVKIWLVSGADVLSLLAVCCSK